MLSIGLLIDEWINGGAKSLEMDVRADSKLDEDWEAKPHPHTSDTSAAEQDIKKVTLDAAADTQLTELN
jgi:hypothetical protein